MTIANAQKLSEMQDDWKLLGACRNREYIDEDGKDLFFDLDNRGRVEDVKLFCVLSCSVREWCLLWALYVPEEDGIWGGMDPEERRQLRSRPDIKKMLKDRNSLVETAL